MADSVRSQLLNGVVWNFIEKVLMRGASFIIGIILARLLSPSDFGLIGMLAVFVAVSNVFIEGGFAKALIQRKNCQDIDFSTAFVSNVGMSLIIYVVLFFSAPLIAEFYEEPILIDLTRILSLNFVLGSFNIVQRAKLMAAVDFKSLAQINVISTVVSGCIGVLMAYCGCGVWSLVGQTLCATVVLMILFPFYSKWSPSVQFSKDSFQHLFGFGSKLMVTGVYSVALNNISIFTINLTVPPPYSTSLPNGHSTSMAALKHCTPTGIPTTLQHHKNPITAHITAPINPPNRNQIRFPSNFIY